ncbi:MBL fold metallo-hydrolase [Alkalihalobacillus sp. LMS39]|uniref:MBL fold metallo-hydrolase n=1 Tax=Alkalihalobacillus sp. LMS39 TaxID=2924032 RepID=UPI001FB47BBD|nr:MBL fold metallo-hydrolase [Alkalihalobacillus sp. LMS39]UOE93284.1 MBL fold metallo-hydrolase [Alkalihalobacillus sp. LMS39]
MKLTVIGCWHGYPEPEEATSGYLIQQDDFSLLLDCGSGVLSHLQRYCPLQKLQAVVVSHYHQDHIADIGVLHYARLIETKLGRASTPLFIYGHKDDERFDTLAYEPYVKSIPYQSNSLLDVGPFAISFLKTKHPAPCYAMKITNGQKEIVYTADTSYFLGLASFAKECDLLIAECSFYKNQETVGGHMNSQDVGILANKARAKQVLLTHLPHFGERTSLLTEVKESYDGQVELASKGWSFT